MSGFQIEFMCSFLSRKYELFITYGHFKQMVEDKNDKNWYRNEVWLKDIVDEPEVLSLFFEKPSMMSRPYPDNGYFINLEEQYEDQGPSFVIPIGRFPYEPLAHSYELEQTLRTILDCIKAQEPERVYQALAEVIQEVTDDNYPHKENMRFLYSGPPLKANYFETRRSSNGSFDFVEPETF